MDREHREYCIKLGNPYYKSEESKDEDMENNLWGDPNINKYNSNNNDNFWLNNNKKFTN